MASDFRFAYYNVQNIKLTILHIGSCPCQFIVLLPVYCNDSIAGKSQKQQATRSPLVSRHSHRRLFLFKDQ